MPVCHERQFIFFHIPRCGGSSLEVFFNLMSQDALFGVRSVGQRVLTLHHMPAPDLAASGLVEEDVLRSYFKFTVIRDPFDRMASDYVWHKRHDVHREFGRLDFKAYLAKAERIIREERYYEKLHYDHFRPMLDYCVHDGQMLVDEILVLENIHQGLAGLQHRLGPVKLPHLNHVRDHSELRTSENIDRVNRLYECDRVLYDNLAAITADG